MVRRGAWRERYFRFRVVIHATLHSLTSLHEQEIRAPSELGCGVCSAADPVMRRKIKWWLPVTVLAAAVLLGAAWLLRPIGFDDLVSNPNPAQSYD